MIRKPHHVTIRLNARLGNQMFEYAFARAMSLRLGAQQVHLYCVDPVCLGCFVLRDDVRFVTDLSGCSSMTRFVSKLCGKVAFWLRNHPWSLYQFELINQWWYNLCGTYFCLDGYIAPKTHLLGLHNPYLVGYFQSEIFFSTFRNEILRDFTFRPEIIESCSDLAECIQSSNSICLHIRLGDYLQSSNHFVCDQEYYNKAIAIVLQLCPEAQFYIFSDCPERVQSLLPSSLSFTLIPAHYSASQSLYLGSLCRHHIISNSTFSWWMQYLAYHEKQIVIAPRRWMNDDTPTPQYQSHWTLL